MSKRFYKSLGKKEAWPNLTGIRASSLTYGDVLLVPQTNTFLKSRESANLTTQFGPYKLRVPIIAAPMDTIVGEKMIRALAELGAIGTLPRNKNFAENVSQCKKFTEEGVPCVYAIGLKNALQDAQTLKKNGAKIVLLDVAHGGMKQMIGAVTAIKKSVKNMWVIAGNIATYEQALWYKKNGVDIARVGVGPGGLCSTRLVAGSGFPQLSAVFETTTTKIPVIADGGIRHPGDAAKALAAGASIIMIGSLFAGCDETPGKIVNGKKRVRGQASESYMRDNHVAPGEYRAAEGIETYVPTKGPVQNVINQIAGGIRSAMSYAGASSLQEFSKKALFTLVSSSAADESRPHIRQ